MVRMNAVDAMFFIYEIRPNSQAGRRRFDPGLPLLESFTCRPLSNICTPYVLHSVDEYGFQSIHSLFLQLDGDFRIDIQIHINRMALLGCNQFWIDFQFIHQRRMGAPEHEEIDPIQADSLQSRTNVPPPDIVARQRFVELLRRKQPTRRSCIGQTLHPSLKVLKKTIGEGGFAYRLWTLRRVEDSPIYTFLDVHVEFADCTASQSKYLSWSHSGDYAEFEDEAVTFTLPECTGGSDWSLLSDTNICDDQEPASFSAGAEYTVTSRSVLLFTLLASERP